MFYKGRRGITLLSHIKAARNNRHKSRGISLFWEWKWAFTGSFCIIVRMLEVKTIIVQDQKDYSSCKRDNILSIKDVLRSQRGNLQQK